MGKWLDNKKNTKQLKDKNHIPSHASNGTEKTVRPAKERIEKMERPKKRRPILRVLGTLALIVLVTTVMLACMAVVYVKIVVLPDVELQLADLNMKLSSEIYYEDKNTGDYVVMDQPLHGEEHRIRVDYEDIPQHLIDAAIAIEDKRFYEHGGVDWIRTLKGTINMFTGQDVQGGSTITQQLIKNATTENQVTVKRKVKEIFRALELESKYSKEYGSDSKKYIMEMYLNYIYLGEGCNGVYTASYAYFDKNVSELSLAECASLIGITNNPSRYNPYQNPEENKKRQENILWQMYQQGFITEEEYNGAVNEKLQFSRGEEQETSVYSWYVDALVEQVIQDLVKEQGLAEHVAAEMVYSKGLKIYSTYDPDVQAAVDAVYNDRANLNYTSGSGQFLQSAITVIDNKTGAVVAIAGGMGEKEGSRAFNRATQSYRPPGSAIKPLSVYAPALELEEITPITTEKDSPYTGTGSPGPNWPVNSYGNYRGNMTMAYAVQVSSNPVAVKVLMNNVTPEVSFDFLQDRFHLERLVKSRTQNGQTFSDIAPAPLALGGLTEGMSTYEMAAAYSSFARGGVYYTPTTYTKVLDNEGNVLLEREREEEVILKEKTTYYLTSMLEGVVQSGTATQANFKGQDIAGKTGTTTSKKDLWFAGYTPYYTAAVWTGYDQQEAMNQTGNPSVGLWRQVMQRVHANLPYESFHAPDEDELVSVTYCKQSGKAATSGCPSTGTIKLYKEDVPTRCAIHRAAISKPKEEPKKEEESTNEGNNTNEDTGGAGGNSPVIPPPSVNTETGT